jgi:hypothetical protein
MAIRNVGGHGVTSILGPHGGQGAIKSTPPFQHNTGGAGHNGIGGPKGSFKMSGGGQKKNSPQAPNKGPTLKLSK